MPITGYILDNILTQISIVINFNNISQLIILFIFLQLYKMLVKYIIWDEKQYALILDG